MRRILLCEVLTGLLVACGTGAAREGRSDSLPMAVVSADAATAANARTPTHDAGATPDASISLETANDPVVALPDLRPSKSWPFVEWERSQAYTFNLQAPGPGTKLRVYSEKQGWNTGAQAGPTLSADQSDEVMHLLAQTQGELLVSKCPFPRHGIVFFVEQTPVASISVCFECGDIMIWPPYNPAPDWEERKSRRMRKLMKAYDQVFPKWQALFEDELGLPTDWTKLP